MKYNIRDNSLQGALPVQISPDYHKPMNNPELWTRLLKAKTKQDKIDACYEWISSNGGFGNCPKDDLAKIRGILV